MHLTNDPQKQDFSDEEFLQATEDATEVMLKWRLLKRVGISNGICRDEYVPCLRL